MEELRAPDAPALEDEPAEASHRSIGSSFGSLALQAFLRLRVRHLGFGFQAFACSSTAQAAVMILLGSNLSCTALYSR